LSAPYLGERRKKMSSQESDLIGKKLGTCTLQKLIGRGGMGEVYLAQQERPNRRVAVKILHPPGLMNSEMYRQFRLRFQRESNLIAQLDHINIVPIYEYGEQDGLTYLVMPYLTGGSLRDLLARQKTLSLSETLEYLKQAATALDYAHAHSIIHRDLKPDNFLLHTDGRLVLADFGIARILQDEGNPNSETSLTGTGMLLGTPFYMAPEMVNNELIDHHTDIYALGIILYQMLSGTVPFTGNSPMMIAVKHLQEPLPALHATNPAIPPSVDTVLQKATAKTPQQRFHSAKDLANAFEQAISYPNLLPETTETPTTLASNTPIAVASDTPTFLIDRSQPRQQNVQNPIIGAFPAADILPSQPLTPHQNTPAPLPYRYYPDTPYPPLQQKPQDRRLWYILLSIPLIVLLIIGGFLISSLFSHNTPTTQTNPGSTPSTASTSNANATATLIPTATPSPTPQTNVIPKGQVLYTTNEPGTPDNATACDGGSEHWIAYNSPSITCQPSNVIIHNPHPPQGSDQNLAGFILGTLSGNQSYPSSNYVIEAQIQADSSSQSAFGLYFRNQVGYQEGIYTLLILPDGSWNCFVYDNTTGAPTLIGNGNIGVSAHAQLTLDVAASGSLYTFYVNGEKVGQVQDATYLNGTAGIVVNAGGTIAISRFTLYSVQ
jgi:serine/threonine protein kinase